MPRAQNQNQQQVRNSAGTIFLFGRPSSIPKRHILHGRRFDLHLFACLCEKICSLRMPRITFGTTSSFVSSFIYRKPDHSSIHQPSSTLTERVDDHAEHWVKFHDSINQSSKPSRSKIRGATNISTGSKTAVVEMKRLESLASVPNQQKVSIGINKNTTSRPTKTPVPKKEFLPPSKVSHLLIQNTLLIIDSSQTAR